MFLLYLSGILALILAMALISVNFLCAEEFRARFYKIFIAADLFVIAGIFLSFAARDFLPNYAVDFLGSFATVFLQSQLICGALVILIWVGRAIYKKFHRPTAFSPERRRALKWGLFAPVMALAISLYGNRIERMQIVDHRFDIPIKKLPPELEGFTVAQISDVHLGAYFSLERLEKLLQRIANEKPDVLTITGDIFDSVSMNDKAIEIVNNFCDKFKHGIFYIHGNHEHFRGISRIEAALAQTKIHVLLNSAENVTSDLYMVGVDYPPAAPVMKSGGRPGADENFFRQKREYLERALASVPYNSVAILLAHHPEFFDDAIKKKIPLTLAGHTHGTQIWGLHLLDFFKYSRGLYEVDDCYLYVNVGVGSWFPMRLGCPPEISWFTLRAE